MIYLFHGSDSDRVRTKALAFVSAARKKHPNAAYLRLEASSVTPETLYEATSMQGLFFNKTLVLLDDPFSLKESADAVLEHLDLLNASQNPVVILAPKLLAARVKKLSPKADKVFVVEAIEKKNTRGFNTALVNALQNKDPVLLWKEILKALREGDAPEMIHGLLHWKARDMMHKGSSAWGKEGARKLSRELIELLSESRGGDLPLTEALERFALSLH